jgi:hypothetical protein
VSVRVCCIFIWRSGLDQRCRPGESVVEDTAVMHHSYCLRPQELPRYSREQAGAGLGCWTVVSFVKRGCRCPVRTALGRILD